MNRPDVSSGRFMGKDIQLSPFRCSPPKNETCHSVPTKALAVARCERRTQRFRNFPNGARFWKNSNAFQRKLLKC